jgi:hypothetical protein
MYNKQKKSLKETIANMDNNEIDELICDLSERFLIPNWYNKDQICDIVDKESLLEALKLLDLNAEIHENPINLKGYRGDVRNEKAHIVIDKQQVNKFTGASNDIGFIWNEESKKYDMICSEYDKRLLIDFRVIQAYAKEAIESVLKKNGFKIKVNIAEEEFKKRQMTDMTLKVRKII